VDRVLCFTWHPPDQVGPDVDRAVVGGKPQHCPDVRAAYAQRSFGGLSGRSLSGCVGAGCGGGAERGGLGAGLELGKLWVHVGLFNC
jgi:hypothetical protein